MNYNRRMQPGDPAMPCVQDPCPCWTAEQLNALRPPTAAEADNFFPNACDDSPSRKLLECITFGPPRGGSDRTCFWQMAVQLAPADQDNGACLAFNLFNTPGPPNAALPLFTPEEEAACIASLAARAALDANPDRWDCLKLFNF